MRSVTAIGDLREQLSAERRAGRSIGFIPTMGALHEGHLRLVDRARELSDVTVMSVFVNPLQFGAGEDFERYPRNLDADARVASERGVHLLFTPTVEAMYGTTRAVEVVPRALADRWEGAVRPGHFAGVLTVVAKLFNIVQPDVAVFGQKDIQQAALIRAMVRDLDFPMRIDVLPTVREADGLALSSRNRYLSADERARALSLWRALSAVRVAWGMGERSAARLHDAGTVLLGDVQLDYLALVDPDSLEPVEFAEPGTIVAVAARVGTTRLIDNLILGADDS